MSLVENDLLELLEELRPLAKNNLDSYCLEIAIAHVLLGYSNRNCRTCYENVQINYYIDILSEKTKEFKRKYNL